MKRYTIAVLEDQGPVVLDMTTTTNLETAISLREKLGAMFPSKTYLVVNAETMATDASEDLNWITDYKFDANDTIRKGRYYD